MRIRRKLINLIIFITMGHSPISHGAQIFCDIDFEDGKNQLRIEPDNDIYKVSTIDLSGRFRFSGQYLPVLNKFKVNTYYNSKDRYVLIVAQEHYVSSSTCDHNFGVNRVYGGPYERDLYFQCRHICNQ